MRADRVGLGRNVRPGKAEITPSIAHDARNDDVRLETVPSQYAVDQWEIRQPWDRYEGGCRRRTLALVGTEHLVDPARIEEIEFVGVRQVVSTHFEDAPHQSFS